MSRSNSPTLQPGTPPASAEFSLEELVSTVMGACHQNGVQFTPADIADTVLTILERRRPSPVSSPAPLRTSLLSMSTLNTNTTINSTI